MRWTVITNCESFLITKCDMVNYRHFDISYPYITFQETPFPTAAAGAHWEVCQHSWAFSPTNSRYIRMILTPDIHIDIWNFSAIAQVLKAVRQLLITTRMLRPPMSVFIVSEGCIYTFTRTRFQFHAVSRRVTFWERLDCKTVGFFSPKEPYPRSLFSASFQTFCLTARVLEYAKIRSVLQSRAGV